MPPQHDTLEYDPQVVSKFLALSPDKQDEVFGSMSSGAQQALLLGLRTLRQSKISGATTPTNIPEVAPSSGKAGTTYRPTGGFVRVPIIGEETKSFGQAGLEAAQETLPGVAKGVGAGIGAAVAPEAIIPEFLGTFVGGAAGEAVEQLTKRATGLGEVPEDSTEAALGLTKAGAEMGLTQLGLRVANEAWRGLSTYFNPLIFGQEGVFRVAGPTADPNFWDNVQSSSWDLANIYKQSERQIRDARGGFLNADHRYQATVDGIKDYLQTMYHEMRDPQVAAAVQYGSRIVVPGNDETLQYAGRLLSNQILPINEQFSMAREAARSLARNPLQPIPIEQANALAIVVNSKEVAPVWEAALSKGKTAMGTLDKGLNVGINTELRRIGQPGVESYERRYAALSRVKEALESKMGKVQAQRTSDRLRAFFSIHGLYARGSVESLEPPGGQLEKALEQLTKAQKKGMIPEPRSSTAVPPRIFEGEAVPPEEGLATTPPRAREVPPGGRGGGMAPPPRYIDIPPRGEPRLLPEQAERRATRGMSPTGQERRTIPFRESGARGPDPMRMAVMKDIQDKINLLEKDDPVRKVLQDRLDDMKAHPFEKAEEGVDIGKVRAAQAKRPSGTPGGMEVTSVRIDKSSTPGMSRYHAKLKGGREYTIDAPSGLNRQRLEAEIDKRLGRSGGMKPPPKLDEPNF